MAIWNERIRSKRQEKGITLAQIADKLGVTEATAQRYESGNIKSVPYDHMCAYGEILGCSPAYLMGWSEAEESAAFKIITEFERISKRTKLFIQLFETYENKITLNSDTVNLRTKTGEYLTIDRKDFMSMIQRCHKDIVYNLDRLIDEYNKKRTSLLPNAASPRTDIERPEGVDTSDDNFMDDESF